MATQHKVKKVEIWIPNVPTGSETIIGCGERPIGRLLEEFFRSDEDSCCFITTQRGKIITFRRTPGLLEVFTEGIEE